MGIERLCYVGLGASDLTAWRAFASQVLALEVAPDSTDDLLYLRMDDHHHRIMVSRSTADDLDFVGWQVRDASALAELAAAVEAEGISVETATAEELAQRHVQAMAWFVDPVTTTRIELVVAPAVQFAPAFRPARPIAGYKTGDLGLGHVVLYVNDMRAAEHFYVDVLGFAISDWATVPGVGNVATFLHCNARHHSLAFMFNPEAPRRINHLMLESLDIDDVGQAYDLCLEQGLVSVTLGRHMNDRAVSFYFRTPSGWHCELGTGAREIDPQTWCAEHYNVAVPHQGEWGHEGLLAMI